MNTRCINIDRYESWCRLFMLLNLLVQACTRGGDYESIRDAIPAEVQLDGNHKA